LALVVAVLFAHIWLGVPDFLPLLAIPAALAAAFISLRAMALTALGETALLLLLSRYPPAGVSLPATGVASLAIWATAGVVY
jgi:hypothetical protein